MIRLAMNTRTRTSGLLLFGLSLKRSCKIVGLWAQGFRVQLGLRRQSLLQAVGVLRLGFGVQGISIYELCWGFEGSRRFVIRALTDDLVQGLGL